MPDPRNKNYGGWPVQGQHRQQRPRKGENQRPIQRCARSIRAKNARNGEAGVEKINKGGSTPPGRTAMCREDCDEAICA